MPDPLQAETSQVRQFIRDVAKDRARPFAGYGDFEHWCIEEAGAFWTRLLGWAGVLCDGDAEPAITSPQCEQACFFPRLRLNFSENLLRLDGPLYHPEREAIVAVAHDGTIRRWNRGQLRAQAEAWSRVLLSLGLTTGDRVALICGNTPEAVAVTLGAAGIGCTVSTLAPELGSHALTARLRLIEPAVLVVDLPAGPGASRGHQRDEKLGAVADGLAPLRAVIVLGDQDLPALPRTPVRRASDLLEAAAGPAPTWPRLPFNQPLYVLFSSGTTGAPKCILHGAGGTLLEHIKEHRLHCDLGPADRLFFQTSTGWMMWNWLVSALASGTTIILNDAPIGTTDSLWRLVCGERVTVFGTSPGYLQMCERANGTPVAGLNFEALRAVLSTGSILQPRQQAWVSRYVKNLPVQSISGGTDIIGCFVLGSPCLPAFSGEPQCRSLGMDVRALGPDGEPAEGIGELVCANPFPSRPLGFLHDDDRQRFHQAYFSRFPGVWTHGDLIEMLPEGSIRMHGRSDGVLNVGGIRIGPAEIYRILENLPEISESMAVEQQDGSAVGGSRLVLLVVLREDCWLDDRLRITIRRVLAREGSPAHVPSVILAVPELPTTYSGKRSETSARDVLNARTAANAEALRNPASLDVLRAFAEQSSNAAAEPEVPADETATGKPAGRGGALSTPAMIALWERVLGIGGLQEGDDFFELGGGSLAALALLSRIAQITGHDLPITTLLGASTIAAFTAAVSGAADAHTPLAIKLREGDPRAPIFIVHGYGGLVMELRPLAQLLRTDAAVYGIRASGFEAGEAVLESVAEMATLYLRAVRQVQPVGPYRLAGYSMGGLVAQELARQLVRQGEHVALLALLDTTTHETYWPASAWIEYLWRRTTHHLRQLRAAPGNPLPIGRLATALGNRIRLAVAAATPIDEHDGGALPESLQKLRDAGLKAFTTHRPAPCQLPVTLIRSELAMSQRCDPRLIWRGTTRTLVVRDASGDHLSMIQPPHVARLADVLSECLQDTAGPPRGASFRNRGQAAGTPA